MKILMKKIVEATKKEAVHEKDNLLRGITFEELIIAVYSNERAINASSVIKVFNEIARERMANANSELRSNMKFIIDKVFKLSYYASK